VNLRELLYDLLDDMRRDGELRLDRSNVGAITPSVADTLNDREDVRGPFFHDEIADMVRRLV
jgi:hypothetical protein